jgi:hypothetical protein
MSNAFNNYLSSTRTGTVLRDYQHASRLYVDSTYARSPKFGFLYFVQLNINPDAVIDQEWSTFDKLDVGLLAKKADLPKFTIATETLNQYNRKTVVQTKLTYAPVSIELHDDNSDITHNLWVNYYKHYYADSNQNPRAFADTKYGTTDYAYGRYESGVNGEFLSSIDIYVLHQGKFTQYTLVNPKITEWQHDSVDQSEGSKIMKNRMSVAYESVEYASGEIIPGQQPYDWAAVYYDKSPSPLSIAGNTANVPNYSRAETGFDKPGAARIYGKVGGQNTTNNPLLDIGMILAKNYVNKNGLGKLGPVGYNIAGGALGALGGAGAGKYSSPPSTQGQPGIFNLPGGVGINIFKGLNTSVDGSTRVNPAALIFPKR